MDGLKDKIDSIKKESKKINDKASYFLDVFDYFYQLGTTFYEDHNFIKFVFKKTRKNIFDLPQEQQLLLLKEYFKGLLS